MASGAATCVTVVPNASASVPATGDGICAAGSRSMTLDCQQLTGRMCGRLPGLRRARAPGVLDPGLPLHHVPHLPAAQRRVGDGWPPACRRRRPRHRQRPERHRRGAHRPPRRPDHAGREPAGGERSWRSTHARDGTRALDQLAALSGDEMIDQPYVPINLAALTEAGIVRRNRARSSSRGDDILRARRPQARRRAVGGHQLDALAGRRRAAWPRACRRRAPPRP